MRDMEKYKKDIDNLIEQGHKMLSYLESYDGLINFSKDYEIWYSEALALVKVLLSHRLEDFKKYYENRKSNSIRDYITSTPSFIDDNIDGFTPRKVDQVKSLFRNQLAIIESIKKRFESSLFDIKQLVQADLFDSEIDVARELLKNGFVRAAGAVAGVVVEKHLKQVCINHNVKVKKRNPHISDYNDTLKNNGVIDTPNWRFIQRLGDIRNLCVHKKDREPTKEEVEELIKGVERITKTLF